MTDHPTTFKGEPASGEGVDWDDRAEVHLADDGRGLFDAGKGVRSGTLAEMVSHIMHYPPEDRGRYVIQKAGDHMLTLAEIEALARRDDFPRS